MPPPQTYHLAPDTAPVSSGFGTIRNSYVRNSFR
mgnify:CR=1 FL=1